MNMSVKTSLRWPAHLGLLVGVVAGMLGGSRAEALSCVTTEFVYLVDPVVIVVSGPGSASDEQARLQNLEFAYLEGPDQITMGSTTFDFEVN